MEQNRSVRLADLVGREVDYEVSAGDTRHGTIARANHSLYGEPVLVIRRAGRRGELLADEVLIGRQAAVVIRNLSVRRGVA